MRREEKRWEKENRGWEGKEKQERKGKGLFLPK